jgi:hypothetical protein
MLFITNEDQEDSFPNSPTNQNQWQDSSATTPTGHAWNSHMGRKTKRRQISRGHQPN